MENQSSNIYKAPESELQVSQEVDGGVENFKRFTAWGVFGLSIITFGIYPLYWLYTRSNILNTFHHNKVSQNILLAFVITIILSYSIGIFSSVYEENAPLAIADGVLSLVYIVFYLIVLFSLHNRLKEVTGDNFNPVLTFFFSSIYMQYKINVAIDRSQ